MNPQTISFTLPKEHDNPESFEPPSGRLPRITRLMALALRFDRMLRRKEVRDYAELASLGQVSRARITQIMHLLDLAPDIQEALLLLPPEQTWRDTISERTFRPIIREIYWRRQRELFAQLFPQHCGKQPEWRTAGMTDGMTR